MYALADQWAESDPGEWKDVCELVCKEKMDKVDVADLQRGSLRIPVTRDGYEGRKGQWSSSELEMGRNELLHGKSPPVCRVWHIYVSDFWWYLHKVSGGRQIGKGMAVVQCKHRFFI